MMKHHKLVWTVAGFALLSAACSKQSASVEPAKLKNFAALPAVTSVSGGAPAAKTNPPSDRTYSFELVARPPVEVTSIVKRACHDCHSNDTAWPWYSNVAPVS